MHLGYTTQPEMLRLVNVNAGEMCLSFCQVRNPREERYPMSLIWTLEMTIFTIFMICITNPGRRNVIFLMLFLYNTLSCTLCSVDALLIELADAVLGNMIPEIMSDVRWVVLVPFREFGGDDRGFMCQRGHGRPEVGRGDERTGPRKRDEFVVVYEMMLVGNEIWECLEAREGERNRPMRRKDRGSVRKRVNS